MSCDCLDLSCSDFGSKHTPNTHALLTTTTTQPTIQRVRFEQVDWYLYHLVQDKTRQDKTRQDKARQGKARQDKKRQNKTRQDKTRQDKTR